MLKEAITLWKQHQSLESEGLSASVIWEDFNQCFYHVQWKSVCLVPPEKTDLPIWLWKKGFQTKRYGLNRRAIYVSDYSKLFKILNLLRDVNIDEIHGLSKESKKRMHYIFPNIPEIPSSLKTKTLDTTIHLPEFLFRGDNDRPVAINASIHFSDNVLWCSIGDRSFNHPIELVSYIALTQQFNCADKLLKLLKDSLEIRKRQIADLDNFRKSLNKRLQRYLVFHEV